jgi:benzoyl-CoA reductase/2-hydroxyglutaryl-CoA dehydratase subunit BcrC/BadD/HgdB
VADASPTLQHLRERLAQEPSLLAEAKKHGQKIVGYFCPDVPEELILGAGLLPVRLVFGGEIGPAIAGEEYLKPYSCPVSRSCVGYMASGNNEYYQLVDAICVAQTCENIKHVQEYAEKRFGKTVIKVGLPHTHDSVRSRPQSLQYYTQELRMMQKQLGDLAGHPVKSGQVKQAIKLCNNIRAELRCLYEFPNKLSTALTWRESFEATHAGFLMQRPDFLRELRLITQQVASRKTAAEKTQKVRIMVMGSVLGIGDHKILDLVDVAGGIVVADNVCTGLANARKDVTVFGILGDPVEALAERYLYNVPCPCMTDLDRRLKRTSALIQEYGVEGIVYYSLKYCDNWRTEFSIFKDYLHKESKTPVLLIESDYQPSDVGTIRTKVEAFVEMIRGI